MTKIYFKFQICLAFFFLSLFGISASAQTILTYNTATPGPGSWVCPAGVTSVQVETWGAGGGGGFARNTNGYAGGGGGGGGYTTTTVIVTPGIQYYYSIGTGGTGGLLSGNTPATSGGMSCFSTTASCIGVLTSAGGGDGGTAAIIAANASGPGGSGGIGGNFNGGNGGNGINVTGATGGGGGGGGGASTIQAGNNGVGKIGGTGGAVGGGNGANGTQNADGLPGGGIGGGGSGGHKNNTNRNGGAGAGGQIRLTFTLPACIAPAQATGFVSGTATSTMLPANFSGTGAGYLVIRSLTNTPPSQPMNGVTYSAANIATLGTGLTFVQSSASTTISGTGLAGNTRYYYFIYAFNAGTCSGGPAYNTSGALTGNGLTCPAVPNTVNKSAITNNSFTLNWTAPTGGTSGTITYTIQVTSDAGYTANVAGSPFTVAAPATSQNIAGLNTGTAYYYRILASNGCSSAYVNGNVLTTGGYCTATTTDPGGLEYINNFTTSNGISNINNSTGFSTTGYGNYTVQSVSQLAGEPINFASSYTGGTHGFAIWVDWNGDADFADTGENVFASGSFNNANTGSFTVPLATATGSYRMRIRADWSLSTVASCGTIPYGETEDYTITVTTPLPCSTYPTSLFTSNLTSTTATLNWGAPSTAPTNGYEYYYSTSPTAPSAATTPSGNTAAGITSANITGLTANTVYYFWVRSNCNGTDKGFWVGYSSFYTAYCNATSSDIGYYIRRFRTAGGLTNIDNLSGNLSAGGYGDFTAMSVSQQPYGVVTFTANYTGNGDTYGFSIWIDWNDDLDFTDAGEKVYGSGMYAANNTGSITVPASAAVGSHRMRIRADYLSPSPEPCGSIDYGETEDYTFIVAALSCSGNPTNLPATGIGLTTATLNWTTASPAPANGYQYYYSASGSAPGYAATPSGTIAGTTVNLTGLASGTVYSVWVRSNCGGNYGIWVGPLNFTTLVAPPITTSANICQGGTGSVSGTATCTGQTNLGNTINGGWDATSDPRAVRPLIFIANSPNCNFDTGGLTANYTALNFTVSITGSYSFTMPNTTAYDAMGYIVIPPFTPGDCSSGTWIVGDDDSGATTFEPLMTATLTQGVIYTLISTLYSGSDIALTNSYTWNVTGPGNIMGLTAGALQWYTTASGGTPIATGSNFNPIGIPGSGLTNTNTPGTTVYYAACSGSPSIRTATNYVITGPTSALSGSGGICSPTGTTLTVNFTGTAPWTFTYSDGTTPVTVTTSLNPYTFNVNPSVASTYTITALNDASCTAVAANRTGNGTVTAKTWNGSLSSNWNNAANWTPASIPTAADCVVVPNVANDPVISGSSYAAYAYSLTILNGGVLQITGTNSITVTDAVNVNTGGQFLLMDSSSLIQVNNIANTGVIDMERTTQPMYRYDYTYWGSPVTLASNYTLGNLSPSTQPDKYYSWIPFIGNSFGTWQQESVATIMDPRKGYIIRAPQTYSTSPSIKVPFTTHFIGTPNNGTINCPVLFGPVSLGVGNYNNKYNLLGNPYPSAVSAAAFLNNANNANVIDGTIYFWTHRSPISVNNADPFYNDFILNYSSSDYASWNKLGGVGTAAGSGGPAPNGFIAAGQSFFVRSMSYSVGNNAVFNNSMRAATYSNSQFFRTGVDSGNTGNPNTEDDDFEKHRIWLNLTNNYNFFCQILIGYAEGATSGWDRGFDGLRLDAANSVTFYSIIPDDILVIQGRALPFDVSDQVPLGFISSRAADFAISIDHIDGLFENQNVYLEDKLLNVIHDLKQGPYPFSTAIGRFDDRFVLRYNNSILSNAAFDSAGLSAFLNDKKLYASASENIEAIDVYEVNGKLIKSYKPTAKMRSFEGDFFYAQGIYFAKIKLENGLVVTQKLLNK